MDGQWNFRHAYDEARKIRDAQDAFCTKAVAGEWAALEAEGAEFPEELQLESLVDILRGRVKVGLFSYCFPNNIYLHQFIFHSSRFIATK
jgi:hypothetical protein